ncbi:hypothetical protein LCGC14_1616030, partial [marine sediment metagenome]
NLHRYDWIVINSGAGDDSLAMLDEVVRLATMQGVERSRLVVVYDDPYDDRFAGRRRALAETQARYYGLRFQGVSRDGPGSTSWRRRAKMITTLVNAVRLNRGNGHPVQALNCFGFHADESPARAKLMVFGRDARLSNSKRLIDTWLPIHAWTTDDVSTRVRKTGVPRIDKKECE